MAAKLHQPLSPSFTKTLKLLPDEFRDRITKQDLIVVEELVVRELDFSFEWDGPLHFLERFERLFEVDQESKPRNKAIKQKARIILLRAIHRSEFLEYKSSQLAGGCLLLAMKMLNTT